MQIYSSAQDLDANFDQSIDEISTLYNIKKMDSLCQYLMTQAKRKFNRNNNRDIN